MLRELVPASGTTFRLYSAEELVSQARPRSASAMTDLFVPLDRLLSCGGDARLSIDPASRVNEYVSKIEWLAAHINDLNLTELCHEA